MRGTLRPAGILFALASLAATPADAEGDAAQADYVAGRFEAARAIWQPLAVPGDAPAAFGMGLLYDLGQGVKANVDDAYGWYLRAAERGMPDAEFNVAVMKDSGRGTSHDASAAAAWYGRAAAHGHHRAEYDLAQLYEAGEGVPRNRDAAIAWYEAAAAALPAAAGRLIELRRTRPAERSDGDDTLVAPRPVSTNAARDPAMPPAELVWSAPPQKVPVRYFVTVLSLGSGNPLPVFSGFADRSAMLLPPGVTAGPYAWRVYAVGTSHYAASQWCRIGGD